MRYLINDDILELTYQLRYLINDDISELLLTLIRIQRILYLPSEKRTTSRCRGKIVLSEETTTREVLKQQT